MTAMTNPTARNRGPVPKKQPAIPGIGKLLTTLFQSLENADTGAIMLLTFVCALGLHAKAATYSLAPNNISSGGGGATGGLYSLQMDIGANAVGIATSTAPQLVKSGYIAQLYDASSLSVYAASTLMDESSTQQIYSVLNLDDATVLALDSNQPAWTVASGPISSLTNGLAVSGIVYTNSPAIVRATYQNFAGQFALTILDSNPDNFGSYANDGLPDWWQAQYFGLNNTNAAPTADPDGDRQNNLYEYIAGTNPTNGASFFALAIARGTNGPQISFLPRYTDRVYVVQSDANLIAPGWPVFNGNITDAGLLRSVSDTNTATIRSFRVQITKP